MSTRPRHASWHYMVLGSLAAAVSVAMVPLFGPFVLAPGLTVACMLSIAVSTRAGRGRRAFLLVVGSLALVLPFMLQQIGLLRASYTFANGVITILPWAVGFPKNGVALLLALETLAVLIVPMLVIGRSIDSLVNAERQLFAQAWTLRQLMPDEAKDAAVASLAEPADEDGDLVCPITGDRRG